MLVAMGAHAQLGELTEVSMLTILFPAGGCVQCANSMCDKQYDVFDKDVVCLESKTFGSMTYAECCSQACMDALELPTGDLQDCNCVGEIDGDNNIEFFVYQKPTDRVLKIPTRATLARQALLSSAGLGK